MVVAKKEEAAPKAEKPAKKEAPREKTVRVRTRTKRIAQD
jgi:hypothetical protein